MTEWIEWAKGPALYGALAFMVLGLVRHLVLTLYEVRRIMRRAGDKTVPYRQIVNATAKWLFPVGQVQTRWGRSATSFIYHIAIVIVPLFLAGHVALIQAGTGFSWATIPALVADILTVVALVATLLLLAQRAASEPTRALSRAQDYLLPLLIAIPFASGLLMAHPGINPFSFNATYLVHLLSAEVIFVLVPITKLSHMVLLPSVQLVAEVAWRWPATSGSDVGAALGKEGEPV